MLSTATQDRLFKELLSDAGVRKNYRRGYYYGLSILLASELVLAFSSVGFINIPPVSITTLHIPVLLAALFFGKEAGAVLGLVFGLASIWKASVLPFVEANAAFSPFLSPDPWGSLVTSVGARVVFGWAAGCIFQALKRRLPEGAAVAAGTVLASYLHSLLVYTSMWFFFPQFKLTPASSFNAFYRFSGIITYVSAIVIVGGICYFFRYTGAGRLAAQSFKATETQPFSRKKLLVTLGFSLGACLTALSLVWYFIDDLNRILSYYHVELTLQTNLLITNMGLQFASGIIAAGVIISIIFVHFYNVMNQATNEAQQVKASFFANISHDMRTPLNGGIGCTELALDSGSLAQKDEYLRDIRASGQLMLDLVNDVLDLSKMQNGMLELKPEPTSMEMLINNIAIPIRTVARGRNIHFEVDWQQAPQGYVLIDRSGMQKILMNLLSNAVKFTPDGGRVRLSLEQDQADPKQCLVTVSDNGVGMEADFLPHIYEPFVQGTNVIASRRGTGLGLSIVKRLVDLMAGTINVVSAPGQGTTFSLKLPFPETEAPVLDKTAAAQDLTVLIGKKVLMCEDNAINALIAQKILEQLGLQVLVAANGQEGVAAFNASRPGELAAILMDLRMPVLDGYSAARQIRALKRSDAASIPILALTAEAYDTDVKKCLAAGMNGHISKPVDRHLLAAGLAEAVAGNLSSRAGENQIN